MFSKAIFIFLTITAVMNFPSPAEAAPDDYLFEPVRLELQRAMQPSAFDSFKSLQASVLPMR